MWETVHSAVEVRRIGIAVPEDPVRAEQGHLEGTFLQIPYISLLNLLRVETPPIYEPSE